MKNYAKYRKSGTINFLVCKPGVHLAYKPGDRHLGAEDHYVSTAGLDGITIKDLAASNGV